MADYEEDFEDFEELDRNESSGYLSMKENIKTMNRDQEIKLSKKKRRPTNASSLAGSKTFLTPSRRGTSKSPLHTSPHDRIISAKARTIAGLQSQLSETRKELEDLRKENKILNRIQARQEKDLAKYESKEGDFPQILRHHSEEIRMWKSKVKKYQDGWESNKRQLEGIQYEVERLKERNRKLEMMNKKKHLDERESLAATVEEMKKKLEKRDKRIVELEHNSQLQAKSNQREVKQLQSKNKALCSEMEQLEQDCQRLRRQLREKEKEIEVKNIYTQRIPRNIPKLLPKLPSTCDVSTSTDISWPNTTDHLTLHHVLDAKRVHKGTPKTSRKDGLGKPHETWSPRASHQESSSFDPSPDEDTVHDDRVSVGHIVEAAQDPSSIQNELHVATTTPIATPTKGTPLSNTPTEGSTVSRYTSTVHPVSDDRINNKDASLQTPPIVDPPQCQLQSLSQGVSLDQHSIGNGKLSEQDPPKWLSKDDKDKLSEQDPPKLLSKDNKDRLSEQDPPKWLSKDNKDRLSEQDPPKWLSKDNKDRLSEQDPPKWLSKDNKDRLSEQDPPKWLSKDNKDRLSEQDPPKWLSEDNKDKLSGQDPLKWLPRDDTPQKKSEEQKAFLLAKLQEIEDSSNAPVTDKLFPSNQRTDHTPVATPPHLTSHLLDSTVTLSDRTNGVHVDVGGARQRVAGESTTLQSSSVASLGSGRSVHQWPNTVENMHHGRPALATEKDPFGTRLSGDVIRHKKSSNSLSAKSSSNDVLSSYKPKYGRRQNATGTKVHDSEKEAFPVSNSPALHGTKLVEPSSLASEDSVSYPWENKVDTKRPHAPSLNGFHPVTSGSKNTALLPHRPAKPLQTQLVGSGVPGTLDDDIEELTLT